jgi:U3 small nucleolar RNA-associated protein 10
VPQRTIAYTAINTPAFFKAYQSYVAKVVKVDHQASHMLSFWSGITVEAIYGILSNSSTGRKDLQDQSTEKLILEVLPVIDSCMKAKHGADTVLACYAIVIMLVHQARVGDKLLDGLMEAVIVAHDETSLQSSLGCLAIIAMERSKAQIPAKVTKRLLKVPQLVQKLNLVSKQCHVERLALGCALGALSDSSDENRSIFHELIASELLSNSRIQTVLSALVQLLRDSAPGSEEHGELVQVATKLIESKEMLSILEAAAKQNNVDLESMGLTVGKTFAIEDVQAVDSDEEMMDVDEEAAQKPQVQLPTITATSLLDPESDSQRQQTFSKPRCHPSKPGSSLHSTSCTKQMHFSIRDISLSWLVSGAATDPSPLDSLPSVLPPHYSRSLRPHIVFSTCSRTLCTHLQILHRSFDVLLQHVSVPLQARLP